MAPPVLDQHPWAEYVCIGFLLIFALIMHALQRWSGFKGNVAVNIRMALFVLFAVLILIALKAGYTNIGSAGLALGVLGGAFIIFINQITRRRTPLQ
jgi:hypothetical protein